MHDLITPPIGIKRYTSMTAMMLDQNVFPKELRYQLRGFSEDYKISHREISDYTLSLPYYIIREEKLIIIDECVWPENPIVINDKYLGPLGIWEYYPCICSINNDTFISIPRAFNYVYRHNQTYTLSYEKEK